MGVAEIAAVALAGVAAGRINTVVGSGTLVTFPVLLAFGYPLVTANVSNTIGLVPGSVSGAWGYRSRLVGQRDRAIRLGSSSLLGGVTGAALMLVLPASTFRAVVPVFIAVAVGMTVLQPRLRGRFSERDGGTRHKGRVLVAVAVFATGLYGGYFGAAQGIPLLGILGVLLAQDLQRTNALKNVLTGLVNGVAGIYFVVAAHVAWEPAGIIAATTIVGAQLGARYGQRLNPRALRVLIVLVGIVAIAFLLTGTS